MYRTSRTTVYKASESEIGGDVDQDEPGVCNLKCIECIHPRYVMFCLKRLILSVNGIRQAEKYTDLWEKSVKSIITCISFETPKHIC